MTLEAERIRQNRYTKAGNTVDFDRKNLAADFDDFHLPAARTLLAHDTGWGVMRGLDVSVTQSGSAITVAPGVARDRSGNLIVRSSAADAVADIRRDKEGAPEPREAPYTLGIPSTVDRICTFPT